MRALCFRIGECWNWKGPWAYSPRAQSQEGEAGVLTKGRGPERQGEPRGSSE